MRNMTRRPAVLLTGRPDRDTVIEHDEIVSLKIDLETLSPFDFNEKYFHPIEFIEDRPQVVLRSSIRR